MCRRCCARTGDGEGGGGRRKRTERRTKSWKKCMRREGGGRSIEGDGEEGGEGEEDADRVDEETGVKDAWRVVRGARAPLIQTRTGRIDIARGRT